MKTGTAARILLCADEAGRVADVRRLLEHDGHEISWRALNESEPEDCAAYHLVVLEDGPSAYDSLRLCRRLRARLSASFLPILYLMSDPTPGARLASLEGASHDQTRVWDAGEQSIDELASSVSLRNAATPSSLTRTIDWTTSTTSLNAFFAMRRRLYVTNGAPFVREAEVPAPYTRCRRQGDGGVTIGDGAPTDVGTSMNASLGTT